MTNILLNNAIDLAEKGFYIFPLRPGGKKPLIENFPELATRDVDQLRLWWQANPTANIGISMNKYNGDGERLVAIDIDNKGIKKGDLALKKLRDEGLILTPTFEQVTPTGGRHLIYKTREIFGQNPLTPELDIRAHNGYLVGAGSIIDGKTYYAFKVAVADATESLIARLKKAKERKTLEVKVEVDQIRATERAKHYLLHEAPLAIQGEHGDNTTFKVACKLKDFGLNPEYAFNCLNYYWNDRCSPPWEHFDLKMKVENAYKHGKDFAGSGAPEIIFDKIEDANDDKLHPILELNKKYAFIIVSGKSFVIYETEREGKFKLEYLTTHAFKEKLLPMTLQFGDKKLQLADLWLKSPHRRSYDGICFMPGLKCPPNLYNLWRGFAFEPQEAEIGSEAMLAVDLFLDHALENICAGDWDLYTWLIAYFAHLIQKPWDKPIVAPVFKGGKGVGKNSFIECIGELLNGHYILVSNNRYLTGNFNSHLENCLLLVLDEAFWSGNKQAEGPLKDLITGQQHVIERKGAEPYSVKNCTRIVIIGNDEWLIPASHDERRFAVFNIGNKRKNDYKFFSTIKKGMANGGYQYLLKFLGDFDFSDINLHKAPHTIGLMEQKISSLSPFYEWWLECLKEGRLVASDFSDDWSIEVERERLRNAYRRFVNERRLKMWGETDTAIGRLLTTCLPTVKYSKRQIEGRRTNTYILPPLDLCRKEWEAFIGYPFNWR